MNKGIQYVLKSAHTMHGIGFSSCGITQAQAGADYGPAMRNTYVIYLVLGGEGEVTANGMQYQLHRDEGFVIRPDDGSFYRSSAANPWTYLWLGFNGGDAEYYLASLGLARGHDTLRVKNAMEFIKVITGCLSHSRSTPEDEIKLNSLTYDFLYRLSEQIVSETVPGMTLSYGDLTRKVMDYIADHYLEPIGVNEVASQLGMNRSYLSREFRRESGMTIKDYIDRIRVTKASDLLLLTNMGLNDIARRCGYGSTEVLAKQFKDVYDTTPARYRQQHETLYSRGDINLQFLSALFE